MKTTNEAIRVLQEMRAELQERINAIDLALTLMQNQNGAPAILDVPADYDEPITLDERPLKAGKARTTKFESAIDFTQLSQPAGPWNCHKCDTYNPSTASVCTKCKAPRPRDAS